MKIEDEKNNPVRIAQIVGKWLGGGVEAVLMNYYREIDKTKIQFDFICDNDSTNIPYEEIERLGGKVILIPPYQKIFKYHKELKRVLKEGKYKIVHSHINTLSVFSLCAAWTAKVPIRIAHSHSTTNKKEWKKNFIKVLLRPFVKIFATDYMACTKHAGEWMFGSKALKNNRIYILNNAIETQKYKFNDKIRKNIINKYNISESTILIGHVGRFVEQKNHAFLIEIFKEYHNQNHDSKLMLIGQGPLVDKMKEKLKDLNLLDKVIFVGQVENVNDYYNAMDLFVFPSLYEGLGMVVVEAQYSGLPCIVSTEVPQIAKISDNVEFVDLNAPFEVWLNELKKYSLRKPRIENEISRNIYDISRESVKLEEEYFSLLAKRRKKI